MPPVEIKKPLTPDVQLSRVRFSPCGTVLAAAAHDGTVRRFDATDLANGAVELPKLTAHNGWVTAMAFPSKTKRLYSGDSWGKLVAWDDAVGTPKKAWEVAAAHDGWLRGLAVSPDGKTVATVGRDGFARLWSADTGAKRKALDGGDDLLAVAFHPGGELVTGDLHGRVKVWDTATGNVARTVENAELYLRHRIQDVGGVRCFAFDAKGETLLVGGAQPKTGGFVQAIPHLFAVDWKTGKRRHAWAGASDNEGYVHDVAWHPAGFAVAVTSGQPGQGKVFVWKPGDAAPHFTAARPNCHSLALSPDGTRLAVSATNANSSGNGRVKGKDGEYPANTSPIHLWALPAAG